MRTEWYVNYVSVKLLFKKQEDRCHYSKHSQMDLEDSWGVVSALCFSYFFTDGRDNQRGTVRKLPNYLLCWFCILFFCRPSESQHFSSMNRSTELKPIVVYLLGSVVYFRCQVLLLWFVKTWLTNSLLSGNIMLNHKVHLA